MVEDQDALTKAFRAHASRRDSSLAENIRFTTSVYRTFRRYDKEQALKLAILRIRRENLVLVEDIRFASSADRCIRNP